MYWLFIWTTQNLGSFSRHVRWWGLHLESSSALEPSPTRAAIQSSFPSYQVQNCFYQGNWDPRRKQLELVEEKPLLLSWAITERGSPPVSYSRLSRDQLVSGILSAGTGKKSLSPPWWAWDGSALRWGQSSSLPVEVHLQSFQDDVASCHWTLMLDSC